MHLASVWTWNWICLCGTTLRAKTHCTGETKMNSSYMLQKQKKIKAHLCIYVYTSFTGHETFLIASVYTVFVAHSGKQG